jgi:hypothetical protein
MDIIGLIVRATGELFEFLFWREDWDRTWSPLSYVFALISALALLVIAVVCGAVAWAWLRQHF